MVTILPAENKWGWLENTLTSGFNAYANSADELALRNTLQRLPQDASPRQILDAITSTSTYSPQAKQQALQNYLGAEQMMQASREAKEVQELKRAQLASQELKERAKVEQQEAEKAEERERVRSLVNMLNIPQEEKLAYSEALDLKAAQELVKSQLTSKGAQTPFEKAVSKKYAEEFVELPNEIAKLQSNAGDIDAARELSDDIGLIKTVAANLGINTQKGQELESIGFTLMQPIVKIFNPSGPIAEKKLAVIQKKYALSPSDSPWAREAKLNALQRFNQQALDRAEKRLKIIESYAAGEVSREVLKQFDKETESLGTVMEDYNPLGQHVPSKDIPVKFRNAARFKGKSLRSPSGKILKSDGTRWYAQE